MVESTTRGKIGEHTGTISRPVQQTLRHTAHGLAFGSSWGNPACLRPMSPGSDDSQRGIYRKFKLTNNKAFYRVLL